jgi:hypothetical protein
MKYAVTDESVDEAVNVWVQLQNDGDLDYEEWDWLSWDNADELRRLMRAALESFAHTLGETVAVPDGWKLVPCEPTVEMLDAGFMAYERTKIKRGHARWYAMLSAAPHHPTTEKGCE